MMLAYEKLSHSYYHSADEPPKSQGMPYGEEWKFGGPLEEEWKFRGPLGGGMEV